MTSPHTFDREEVMAYLDGELPAPQAASMRAHLERCESCRALADELRAISSSLGEWQVEPAPTVLDVSVRAALDAAPLSGRAGASDGPPSKWRPWFGLPLLPFAGAAAAIAIVAFVTWPIAEPRIDPVPALPAVAELPQSDSAAQSKMMPVPVSPPAASDPAPPSSQAQQAQGNMSSRTGAGSERSAAGRARREATPDPARPAPIQPPLLTSLPATPPLPPLATEPPPPPAAAPRSAYGAVPVLPGVGQAQTTAKPTQTADARAAGAGAGRGGRGGGERAMNELVLDSVSGVAITPVDALLAAMPRPVEARSVDMVIVTDRFDAARPALAAIVGREHGSTQALTTRGEAPEPRTLEAEISVPLARIDAALVSLKDLGRVARETQTKDNLDERIADLQDQLKKVRLDEAQFRDVLGRASTDPAAAEATRQALARARAERVRLEKEARALHTRVANVMIAVRIEEGRRAPRQR
jgi:hypothetical protein